MSDGDYIEFEYKGHDIRIRPKKVPGGWLGDLNTVFTVVIDSAETEVPGIWNAYQTDGEKGITLVIQAYLDLS